MHHATRHLMSHSIRHAMDHIMRYLMHHLVPHVPAAAMGLSLSPSYHPPGAIVGHLLEQVRAHLPREERSQRNL